MIFLTECPVGCLKCYFRKDSDSVPACYASQCAKNKGFNDEFGTCFDCTFGCEYCQKMSGGNICHKCALGFAPKYNSKNQIESCASCSSLEGCSYCEFIDSKLVCLRSPCASKALSSNNKKFSFSNKDCSTSCPTDVSCASGSVNDENDICYCRSCPEGSLVIQNGPNAGVCKSCGVNCDLCVLTSNKEDVECKTCKGARQWITVFRGSSYVKGCYGTVKYLKKYFLKANFFYAILRLHESTTPL